MTLEQARNGIGRRVIYQNTRVIHENTRETGVISSVGVRFVFVRYGSDPNAKATRPEDLTFEYEDLQP